MKSTESQHASSTTKTTQFCVVGLQFKLSKKYCKSVTDKNTLLVGMKARFMAKVDREKKSYVFYSLV